MADVKKPQPPKQYVALVLINFAGLQIPVEVAKDQMIPREVIDKLAAAKVKDLVDAGLMKEAT